MTTPTTTTDATGSAPVDVQRLVRLACDDYRCGWQGNGNTVLRAPNPFDATDELLGCPRCKSVDTIRTCCDEIGCWEQDTCGTPTPDGYRRTCHKHKPNDQAHRSAPGGEVERKGNDGKAN